MKTSARIQSVIELLSEILATTTIPANDLCHTYFSKRRFIGSGDRRFIADMTYEVIRYFPKLEWFWRDLEAREAVLTYLVIKINETLERIEELFTGENFAPEPLTKAEIKHLKKLPSLKEIPEWAELSIPEWIFPYFQKSLGIHAQTELKMLEHQAPMDLRVNTLKRTREEALKILKNEGFLDSKPTTFSPVGIRLSKRMPLQELSLWKDGTLEVQDEGSQLIALLCNAKPGMAIIDYCAGAGGKALVLAETMNNKGRLVLSDIHEWRLKRSKERLKRAGIHNYELRLLEQKEWFKRQEVRFDCVLVDAPCSGTGTWRRNPDMKLRFSKQDLEELLEKQADILKSASKLVKLNGSLVYSTCSLLREENHEQIEKFISQNPAFALVPIQQAWETSTIEHACPTTESMLQLTSAAYQTDGFFVAVLKRTGI